MGAARRDWWRRGPLVCVVAAAGLAVWSPLAAGPTGGQAGSNDVLVEATGAAAATGTGAGPGAAAVALDNAQGDVADIYRRDCAVCHGADAEGTERGPGLAGAGLALVDYMIRTGRMPIAEPDDEIGRSAPAYDGPTVDALVAYVGGLQDGAVADGPPIPDVDRATGDVALGGATWRLNCASCHQWSGAGGAMLDQSAPGVRDASALELAEAVRAGPRAMPRFGPAAVTDQELDSLAAYLHEELKQPQDPGGWSVGHIGPLGEGAVAVVVIGLLGVITRVLGAGRDGHKPDGEEP